MEKSNHSESTFLSIDGKDILMERTLSKKIRGSNFSKNARFYIDSKQRCWLWKQTPISKLISAYIVSILASILNLPIPKAFIANNGHSIGLIQEWFADVSELYYQNNTNVHLCNSDQLYDLLVFEAWIGAMDRHGGNYLIQNGTIWGIDYEECFSYLIHGSELCLYFPWLKGSDTKLQESIHRLKKKIQEKKILDENILNQKVANLFKIAKMKDPRFVFAIKCRFKDIMSLLRENFSRLDLLVYTYIKTSSFSSESTFVF